MWVLEHVLEKGREKACYLTTTPIIKEVGGVAKHTHVITHVYELW